MICFFCLLWFVLTAQKAKVLFYSFGVSGRLCLCRFTAPPVGMAYVLHCFHNGVVAMCKQTFSDLKKTNQEHCRVYIVLDVLMCVHVS